MRLVNNSSLHHNWDVSWEEAEVAALNRQEWRWSVAQYVHLVDVG